MIIFDTETTGIPVPTQASVYNQPRIFEFAAIKVDPLTLDILDKVEFLCNPKVRLEPIIQRLTGCNDSKLINKPFFESYIPKIEEFFKGVDYLVAHNLSFDIKMLSFEFERQNKKIELPKILIDTLVVAKTFIRGNVNMNEVHKELFGFPFHNQHSAMGDTEALLRIFKKMKEEGYVKYDQFKS